MCFVLLAGVITAIADDVVSVSDTSVPKGAKGTFSINLTNTTTNYTGFEMVLTLPTGVTFSKATLGNRFGDHTVSTNTPYNNDSQKTKIVVSSSNSALITGTSGSLLTIEVNVSADASVGNLSGASLTDVKFSTGTLYALSDVAFNLNITNGIVLNEDDYALPASQNNVDVTVKRTLKAAVWNTICLPFGMTAEKVNTAFGTNATICEFASCSKSGNTISVNFTKKTDKILMPNIPYLLKIDTDNITEFSVTGAYISPNEGGAKKNYEETDPQTFQQVLVGSFIGTLKAGTIIPADNLFISDNQFWYSDGTNTIKGFRGYFWLRDFKSSSTGASRLILSVDGEPTGIYDISSETGAFTIEDGRIYNLNGMELNSPAKKGIYIQNGKKIVVK